MKTNKFIASFSALAALALSAVSASAATQVPREFLRDVQPVPSIVVDDPNDQYEGIMSTSAVTPDGIDHSGYVDPDPNQVFDKGNPDSWIGNEGNLVDPEFSQPTVNVPITTLPAPIHSNPVIILPGSEGHQGITTLPAPVTGSFQDITSIPANILDPGFSQPTVGTPVTNYPASVTADGVDHSGYVTPDPNQKFDGDPEFSTMPVASDGAANTNPVDAIPLPAQAPDGFPDITTIPDDQVDPLFNRPTIVNGESDIPEGAQIDDINHQGITTLPAPVTSLPGYGYQRTFVSAVLKSNPELSFNFTINTHKGTSVTAAAQEQLKLLGLNPDNFDILYKQPRA